MHLAAHRRASRRSGWIGPPHRTHAPNVPAAIRARASSTRMSWLSARSRNARSRCCAKTWLAAAACDPYVILPGATIASPMSPTSLARSATRAASIDSMSEASTGRWYASRILHGSTQHEETRMAIEIDPVCGMSVDTTTSQLSLDHDGTTYWFCSKGCLLDFQDDPQAFLGSDAKRTMPPAPAD